ncbi:hypothetical protein V6N13_017149 [Hibiscus sabdariffa]
MEDPSQSKVNGNADGIGGTWKQSIKVAFEATKSAFPGGEVLAHLDQKSFKGWQKNAITAYLVTSEDWWKFELLTNREDQKKKEDSEQVPYHSFVDSGFCWTECRRIYEG